MPELPAAMTMVDFARLHRISRAAAYKWKARGLIVHTVDNLVDVVASNNLLAARPPIVRGRKTKGPAAADAPAPDGDPGWSLSEAVRREKVAAARLRELELAREAGLVVLKAEVTDVARGEYTIVRTAMLGLASKLAHRLAAASTPEECGALVDGEVRSILEALTMDEGKE